MVLESGVVHVKPGDEAKFEAGVAQARSALEGAEGCRKLELRRCVENPSDYLLLVWWDSIEHHMAFRNSERFGAWLAPIGALVAGPTAVFHYAEPI